jgi:hypothetical protein
VLDIKSFVTNLIFPAEMSAKLYLDGSTASHVVSYVAAFAQYKHDTIELTDQAKESAEFKSISAKGEVYNVIFEHRINFNPLVFSFDYDNLIILKLYKF